MSKYQSKNHNLTRQNLAENVTLKIKIPLNLDLFPRKQCKAIYFKYSCTYCKKTILILSENPATKFLINQSVSTSFKLVKRKPNEGLNRAKKTKKTTKKKEPLLFTIKC